MRNTAIILSAVLAATLAPPVLAQPPGVIASAEGSVVIDQPVGTGIAYDVLTDLLSGVFLLGQQGDSVSLTMPGHGTGSAFGMIGGEVVVLSTASYGFALRQPVALANDPGQLLFLAQFN